MKPLLFIAIAALSSSFGSSAFAQEGRIRQSSQNRVVEGQLFGQLRFSATVNGLTDIVEVKTRTGQVFARMTAAQFITSGFVTAVIPNSGGNITLRVRFNSAQPVFHRGTVAIISPAGVVRDRDRIILR